ncbi:nectin-4-like [Seriola dumerili]|uniref:nectin-4-like n=1 Tax=Seriola dumerili TaxID=41447 RepID=UPI000BBE2343|nr:nectin-4-like [Seriola dumerili]
MLLMALFLFVLALVPLICSHVTEAAQEVKVKPGEDATLHCGRDGATIGVLTWKKLNIYLLFFRDNHLVANFQDPSYRDRVALIDPELKSGDGSVVLRNITFEDAGRYECYLKEEQLGRNKRDTGIRSVIDLIVEDDRGPTVDGGNEDGHVGLMVGLSVAGGVVAVAVAAAAVKCRKRPPSSPADDGCDL